MACIPLYLPRGLEILRDYIRLARARHEVQDMAAPLTYIWFYQRVRNRGPWDYKQKNKLWADYGNFHYGAVGYAAGIPAEILHIAAGAAQEVAKTSLPVWGHFYSDAPFGDDPRDQFWIKQGIDYVKQHHY
ncbi:type IV secretion protein Rhs [Enterobacter sp. K16B]|uniref:polymorphic toxin type 44 domain-containing protein n=1 Tax=Enterobacter sp. K16B TaxID=2878537 RepID=UPI001CD92D01|nr:polymorphic toxin type 44 domain-containing protein [Enterobacter sp. K16B]MCA2028392.1 type IV secretion protein Rhs [Enterobacter sp. K16B]